MDKINIKVIKSCPISQDFFTSFQNVLSGIVVIQLNVAYVFIWWILVSIILCGSYYTILSASSSTFFFRLHCHWSGILLHLSELYHARISIYFLKNISATPNFLSSFFISHFIEYTSSALVTLRNIFLPHIRASHTVFQSEPGACC